MACDGGESSAPEDYEVLLTENKRKFDKTANGNWDGRKMGVLAALVPSFSNMRPSLKEFDLEKHSVLDIAAGSSAKVKRPRTEDAAADHSDLIRAKGVDLGATLADDHFKCAHNQPAEETLPMQHQQVHQGAQFCDREGSCQLGKIDPLNLEEATAGRAGDVGALEIAGMKMIDGKVTIFIDSGEVLRVLNQVPKKKTFAIKVKSAQNSIEFWWGHGAV